MAQPRTLTVANSIFTITIPGLYDVPMQLEGYSADAAFAVDSVATSESHIGVDGRHSAGRIQALKKIKINLAGDSESVDIFDTLNNAEQDQNEIFWIWVVIDLPGVGKSYDCAKGVMSNYKSFPDAKKVLQSIEFDLTFESITQINI